MHSWLELSIVYSHEQKKKKEVACCVWYVYGIQYVFKRKEKKTFPHIGWFALILNHGQSLFRGLLVLVLVLAALYQNGAKKTNDTGT